ncbi:MAG: hypothetical protein RR406_00345 [Bacilli bacterium]
MKKETTKKTEETLKELNTIAKKAVKKIEEQEVILAKEKTIEKIAEDLKKEHKEVYITDIAGLQIVWRKLKRSEYKELMTTTFDENEELQFLEKQDFVAKKVILFPENVEELIEEYAGIADLIATESMVKTGFGLTNTRAV